MIHWSLFNNDNIRRLKRSIDVSTFRSMTTAHPESRTTHLFLTTSHASHLKEVKKITIRLEHSLRFQSHFKLTPTRSVDCNETETRCYMRLLWIHKKIFTTSTYYKNYTKAKNLGSKELEFFNRRKFTMAIKSGGHIQ